MIVLIALVLIQGFMLAWIAQLVAHEEVEVKTGVLVVVITAVLSTIAGLALRGTLGLWPTAILQIIIYYGVLSTLLKMMAHLGWKHSGIIAGIYTVLYLATIVGTAMLLS